MTRLNRCLRKRALTSSLLAASLLLTPPLVSSSWAQLYEYRDESGRRVFVDRLSAVPLEYREQLISRERVESSDAQRLESQRLRQITELELALRRLDNLLASAVSPISFSNNQVVVPVEIARGNKRRQLKLLLDTGANQTVFHRQAVSNLATDERLVGSARTASGEAIPLFRTHLDRIQIGPFEISPAPVQLLDFEGSAAHQGLLGMDLLSQIDYQLDLEGGKLIWAAAQVEELRSKRAALVARLEQLKIAD